MPEEPTAQEPQPAATPEPEAVLTTALTAELGKKAGVCWLRYDGRDHAVWHVWLEEALYVLSGGEEQPLPGIEDLDRVEVVMRSKDSGGRLLRWVGEVSAVRPDDESWEPVTAALVGGRLNLPDLATAADGWAAGSRVTRVVPTGEVPEAPGRLPDDAHLATPRPTRATTRGPLPRVLHRRARRGPGLS